MNYLSLENATKTYGEKVLFKDLDLHVYEGDKIALVARNGSGKSTLIRVLVGMESPEGELASYYLRKDIRMSYLSQDPDFYEDQSVMEAVLEAENELIDAIKEYENAMLDPSEDEALQKALIKMDETEAWDFEARVKEVLFKLGFRDLTLRVSQLSGGQLKRLALAKIILEEPEFLILDEPTNHLDVDMIEWLENYLRNPGLTLFMVTHDRYFLERVCNNIVELDRGHLYRYQGNYSAFLEKKTIRMENEAVEVQKAGKLMKKELEWIRRMPKARGTKAKSRVDAFDDIEEKASRKTDDQAMKMDFKTARLGSKILEAQYISKSYGDLVLVDNFHYKFKKKERVGIVGPNGVGKTTFLRMLTGQESPDSGKIVIGETVVFGYYTQDGLQLPEDKTVIEVVRDVAEFIPMEKGYKLTAIQLLDRFLFSREQHQVYVSQLSGGEKRRLFLLTILMKNPNFLILDEPTNDLDILTLNVLEEFLMDFPGCLVIVTHDRYFMDKLVDHLFVFQGHGKIKDFLGDYSEYRSWILEYDREQRRKQKEEASQNKKSDQGKQGDQKPRLSYHQKKEMERIEKELSELERKKKEIFETFNAPGLPSEEIEELSITLGRIDKEIESKETRWMELAEGS